MSASAGLQKFIRAALLADAGISALIGDRVYDRRPDDPQFPYVSFGASDFSPDNMEGLSARIETIQIDVWSRAVGAVECRRLNDLIKAALHQAGGEMDGGDLVLMNVLTVRTMRDPDQLTTHGVLTIEAHIEEEVAG